MTRGWAAEAVGGVHLVVAVTGYVHVEVARHGQHGDAAGDRVQTHQHLRVRAPRVARGAGVAADQQDVHGMARQLALEDRLGLRDLVGHGLAAVAQRAHGAVGPAHGDAGRAQGEHHQHGAQGLERHVAAERKVQGHQGHDGQGQGGRTVNGPARHLARHTRQIQPAARVAPQFGAVAPHQHGAAAHGAGQQGPEQHVAQGHARRRGRRCRAPAPGGGPFTGSWHHPHGLVLTAPVDPIAHAARRLPPPAGGAVSRPLPRRRRPRRPRRALRDSAPHPPPGRAACP